MGSSPMRWSLHIFVGFDVGFGAHHPKDWTEETRMRTGRMVVRNGGFIFEAREWRAQGPEAFWQTSTRRSYSYEYDHFCTHFMRSKPQLDEFQREL